MGEKISKKQAAIFGAVIGLINGIFGSGGGVAAVYAFEKKGKMEARKSHATADAVILPISIVSAAVYLFKADILILNVLQASAGGVIGGLLGALLLSKISNNLIHKIFGVVIIASAVRMLII